jgi:hypothetical protein
MVKPTERQLNTITMIQDNLKIQFRGSTLKEAQEFIGKYIYRSMAARAIAFIDSEAEEGRVPIYCIEDGKGNSVFQDAVNRSYHTMDGGYDFKFDDRELEDNE